MPRLSLALAQLDQTVGDVAANARAMLAARAHAGACDLVVTPELSLIGYPPEDLVLAPALIGSAERELQALARATADGGPALLVGTARPTPAGLVNAMVLLAGGRIAGATAKQLLPNEGVFDEKRVFVPGPPSGPLLCPAADAGEVPLGVLVCEDMWAPGPAAAAAGAGARLLLVTNGSPFEPDKADRRLTLARARAAETGLALAYLNRVGGQDELVFDGGSFALQPEGTPAARAPEWAEAMLSVAWADGRFAPGALAACPGPDERLWRAMAVGLASYVRFSGLPGVILGLSGGIDSALTAALAVDALGAERVRALMLPSRHTSAASLEDAADIARRLGIRLDTVDIEPTVEALSASLGPLFDERPADPALALARENLQSRARALLLMAASNRLGPMLLTTGNKSELAVGYATLYGDMAGGYGVLKDLWKTQVFRLARWRNGTRPDLMLGPEGAVMPQRVITRPPSAELAPDQKDEDSLPPYDRLDAMLAHLVEERGSVAGLVERGFGADEAARVERLLHASEYKRRQAPPGVKLSALHFGRDRRLPLMHGWRSS